MSDLLDTMMRDLEAAGYVETTQKVYHSSAVAFSGYFQRCPSDLGANEIREWFEHLQKERGIGPKRMTHHIAALKFLYTKTIHKPEAVSFLSYPKCKPTLPNVLAAAQIERLLAALHEPKYRVLFTTMYATGMRIHEACTLETGDIKSEAGMVLLGHASIETTTRYAQVSTKLITGAPSPLDALKLKK